MIERDIFSDTPETHAVQGVFKIFNFLEILSYAWEIKFVFWFGKLLYYLCFFSVYEWNIFLSII